MLCSHRKFLPVVVFFGANIFFGCGGGSGGGTTMPATPTFTSTPVTAAEEGVMYSYQVTATSSDMSAITYELSGGPTGATLAGNTVTWTPTHGESRVANAFTVKATTASGGSATQTWNVTPNGTVNITAVTTYWLPEGTTSTHPTWQANLPYPAALVPQLDGTLQRLQGAANADGTFSIPNVPTGYYWLQINPNANFWTPTSDFDYGEDLAGRPLRATAQSATTFATTVTGLVSSASIGDYFLTLTDLRSPFSPASGVVFSGSSTFTSNFSITSDIDWSAITTLYLSQYQHISNGNFTGYVLGPSQTLSNISFTDGGTNTITGALAPYSTVSLPLSVTGTAWANLAAGMGPGNPTPVTSDFSAFVEPYVTGRSSTSNTTLQLGPAFTLLRPSDRTGFFPLPPPYPCGVAISIGTFPALGQGNPPIVTDTDYGTIAYSDPYPAEWQRNFQYCQLSNVNLQRPNSTVTDTFTVGTSQITPIPKGPVAPILGSVQSPLLNGSSLFSPATLNTTSVTLNWNAPAIGQPFGYYVTVFQLVTGPTGTVGYASAGVYGTGKTTVNIPFLSANNIYVFSITAMADAISNIELAPLRHQVPTARAGVISAPMVIAAGATAAVRR